MLVYLFLLLLEQILTPQQFYFLTMIVSIFLQLGSFSRSTSRSAWSSKSVHLGIVEADNCLQFDIFPLAQQIVSEHSISAIFLHTHNFHIHHDKAVAQMCSEKNLKSSIAADHVYFFGGIVKNISS